VIAVGQALRRLSPGAAFLYLGTTSGPEEVMVRSAGFDFYGLPAGRLRRYVTVQNLGTPFLVGAGIVQATRWVRRFRPNVAFGAGGFGTLTPLLAARLQGVPIAVHQQDVAPGLANRILAPLAAQVTVALPETASLLKTPAVVTGNPVRAEFVQGDAARGRSSLAVEDGQPLLLVTGGGTGALQLNRIVAEAARDLVEVCAIVHLTGAGKAVLGPQHPRYQQREFVADGMADVIAAADLVVSRAGMSSLTELAAMRKAAILVPMPRSHQEANAAALARHGAAQVIPETELTPERLAASVRALLDDAERRQAQGDAAARLLPPDAADTIARRLIALACA
jgi:UDP-N-acetylglucosamine--N-acetylmuramyl-(pentapeptide) pyrophosphoryl-undecaprenol N-acetylglucosamine transferase